MKQKTKRVFGILINLFMVLGLMAGMSLTAHADGVKAYTAYDVTTIDNNNKDGDALTELRVTFNGMPWYLIEDNSTAVNAGTVTLLAADTGFGEFCFDIDDELYGEGNSYNRSDVKTYLDYIVAGIAGEKMPYLKDVPNFKEVADAIQPVTLITYQYDVNGMIKASETTENAKLYLLSIDEAKALPKNVRKFSEYSWWWLRSPSCRDECFAADVSSDTGDVDDNFGDSVRFVFGVRPALKLNLSSVIFESTSKTFSLKQTIIAENVTATYGEVGKRVSASVTNPVTGGDAINYAVKTGSEDYIDVDATTGVLKIKKVPSDGKAYVIVTAAKNASYGKTTKEVIVTIKKADATASKVNPDGRIYDGTEKELVIVDNSTLVGGTIQYALGTNDNIAPTDGWGTSIPKAADAGTYYVWYKVVGDANHNDSDPKCVSVTISAAGSPDNQNPGKKDSDNGGNNPSSQIPKTTLTEVKERIKKVPSSVKVKVKKNKVTVSWKKIKKTKKTKKLLSQIKGIQVQYSTDKRFNNNVVTKKLGKSKTKITLKLKKKKTYFIRVRYVGKDGYSKWTKAKRVKTK